MTLAESLQSILTREPHLPARFYDVLCRLHPEIAALFGNRTRQAEMFARMLVAIVDRYEDRPWIDEQLAALGRRHAKFALSPATYRSFNTALLVTLEEAAGEDWTAALESEWSRALDDIATNMQSTAA